MKKTFITSLVMAAAVVMVSSCGGAGKVQNTSVAQETNPYGTSVFQTECEKYALADPVRRSVGKGVSFNESTAKNLAELDARAAMSRAIDAAVEDAAKSSGFGYQ